MNSLLKVLPVPLSGLMLGVVALAKLFYMLQLARLGQLFMVIGLVCCLLLICKCIWHFSDVQQQLKNPVIASVAPTFSMGLMVIASVFDWHNAPQWLVNAIWCMAVVLHVVLMAYFIYHFMIKAKLSIQSVFPSWFVTFVGIGMMPVTAPAFTKAWTANIVYIAAICFLVLLPLVLKHVFIRRDLPQPTKPLIAILAAPASLCTLAYMTQFHVRVEMALTGVVIAQLLYFIVLYELQTLLKLPFYPSFAGFTFPLVVSATTLYTATQKIASLPEWVTAVVYFEVIIATAVVCFVLVMYTKYVVVQIQQSMTVKA